MICMRHLAENIGGEPCPSLAPGFRVLTYLSKYYSSFSGLTRESRVISGEAYLSIVSQIPAGLDPRVKPEDDEHEINPIIDDVTASIPIA